MNHRLWLTVQQRVELAWYMGDVSRAVRKHRARKLRELGCSPILGEKHGTKSDKS